MKQFLLLAALLVLLSGTSFATEPGAGYVFLSGTVTDKSSNESLPGVEVRVRGTDIVTYTNFDGNFFLPELPAGTYTLEFNYITYSTTSVEANGSGSTSGLAVEMQQR